jgi:4-aminobutyrate aminotransferase-like enzyme/Ser/Thr protein kinase RdoA (MazF antagonist)
MTFELDVHPRPSTDEEAAARIVREHFGIEGGVRELGSHQDRNFAVDSPAGRLVLKVPNASWGRAALEAQNSALLHLGAAGLPVEVPAPVPARDGALVAEVDVDGHPTPVRLLTYVHGSPLSDSAYLAPAVVADLGRLSAQTCAALATFDHPGLDRVVQWDLRIGAEVVDALAPSVADASLRDRLVALTGRAMAAIDGLDLRVQAVHGDLTDDNVVGERDEAGRLRPRGIIDFGDLMRSWVVADLAVTCASLLRHSPSDPLVVLDAVRAFDEVVTLTDDEIAAFWPLVVLRGAVLVVAGEHQASLDPDNESVTGPLESERLILDVAASLPFAVAEECVRAALGRPARADRVTRSAVVSTASRVVTVTAGVVDLSVLSDDLGDGAFLDPGTEARLLRAAREESGAATTRYAEARLTRTALDSDVAASTVALGVELALEPGTAVLAPWAGQVETTDGGVVLRGADLSLHLRGLLDPATGPIEAASPLGHAGEDVVVLVLSTEPDLDPPLVVTPALAAGWLRVCPDPSPLIGAETAGSDDDPDGLLERRLASFATVQEHYYERPMRIERGWRHHLVDTEGRAYVDMVNNVAAVGHAHPRLTDAVTRQMRLLNTNSRFHYAAVAELSERLATLAPEGLDTVFLVNSGSEAVDLALRMAQVVTGRWDVVAVREAYHGWTLLSDAVTTSLYDNPAALETRPDWIHLASAPNTFRGRFRGPDSGPEYVAEMRDLVAGMVSAGRPPAAFIGEPLFGNAGGVDLPPGYLGPVYEVIRAAGGLAIADEVQVGYGRTGHHWWAFEEHGVVPDVITVAKAMGNGHPLGAVITRRDIAEAFAAQGSFFSSAGGSPVSCVVGLTVLDIIEDEGLQANAREVGDHIVARCTELMAEHPIIGAVHGRGLYLGVELVRDRDTLEPATAECYAICERLRELGVIVQPTGERANVLKIKPPMCLTRASADFVVDQLSRVLREGW